VSKIKILPEILSNKIAAGEVVERPSSVVKELVENSLDAQSTRISIEVEGGGRSLVRVADNGTGMSRDDALLALERYATSKIYKDRDLFSISTLGFRGEALPSIASVSRFSLVTRDRTAQTGTEIIVEGGTIKKVSEAGAPVGTMVTVRQIFYNTPARRKFLKTAETEMAHIGDIVSGIAIGWPNVRFRLYHNGKTVRSWSASPDPVDRIADAVGRDLQTELHRIQYDDPAISITGWISSPRIIRSTSRGIYIYVNSRLVRDRVIQHALFEGYAGRLMKGRFPVAVLFLTVPFDQVDVNVHPTKNEVRFAQQSRIHDTVKSAVSESLSLADRPRWTGVKPSVQKKPIVSEPASRYGGEKKEIFLRTDAEEDKKNIRASSAADDGQTKLWDKKCFGDLKVIGQLHDTYIVCESDEGLVLLDQHAAHERILFERLKQAPIDEKIPSQKLLIPETIDLGYKDADIMKRLIPHLRKFGLEIEPFGGNTFVVQTIPSLLAGREIKPILMEIVEKTGECGVAVGAEKAVDRCLTLMACHGAVRANQHLSDEQLKGLLDQLDECVHPSHCPHGRPTWIRWTLTSLEKSFKRII
jgi:DNA mismatch repair protein MutL